MLRSRRTRHLAPVIAVLTLALFGQAAEAQNKGRTKKRLTSGAAARSEADELADEEARKAAEERASRVPTVVEEKKREKVEVQDKPALKFEQTILVTKYTFTVSSFSRCLSTMPSNTKNSALL